MTLLHYPSVRAGVLFVGVVLLSQSAAPAQRLPKDPVEKFRQALIIENNKDPKYKDRLAKEGKGKALTKALAFRRTNLESASANLTSLNDMSRALLLIDWPQVLKANIGDEPSRFDRESRIIEYRVREKLAKRFRDGVQQTLENPNAPASSKVAVANLLGETIAQAEQFDLRLLLYHDLTPLAWVLREEVDNSDSGVRVAIARALGQFPNEPFLVTPGLEDLLDTKYDEKTRKAAADSLLTLALSISNSKPIKSSVPGIVTREGQVNRRQFTHLETISIVDLVTEAASAGMDDPSPAIRRLCMAAIRHTAGGLAFELRFLSQSPNTELSNPPRERTDRSADEKMRLRSARAAQERELKNFDACLNGYIVYASMLKKALRDPDAEVRLEACRTLDELARTRGARRDLKESIPEDAKPDVDLDLTRRKAPARRKVSARQTIRLVSGTKTEVTSTRKQTLPLRNLPRLKRAAAPKSDQITDLLNDIASDLANDGLCDPDVKVRLAAHEAIEALGDAAIPLIPKLAKSLADPDVFVRWVTARTLRKIAEEDERLDRASKHTDLVIPALIKGLDDEDLDSRTAMTRALGAYGPDAKSAIPGLTQHLSKGDAVYRAIVIKALESIGEDSKGAIPELVKALQDPDARIRAEAARLIGLLAKYAGDYLPDLEKLMSDPDSKVRENASAAILAIQSK